MKKYKNLKVSAFNGWEINRVCIDFYDDEELLFPADLYLDTAKQLVEDLKKAIESFEDMDKVCKEEFARMKVEDSLKDEKTLKEEENERNSF